ncbi:MAG: hypothetical protein J6D06_09800 [Clostridia bacterium]|nr:hypothetical protein [Clostridia bacterium]
MPVLYVLAGIVALFVILFSLRVSLIIDYSDKTVVTLKYLFLKIPLVDTSKPEKEKKEKKKKTDKKKDTETDTKTDENKTADATVSATDGEEAATDGTSTATETAKPEKNQGNSLLKQLYIDEGYDGIEKMLRAVGNSLGKFFGKLYKTLVFDELYITMITVGSDAADTAIKHGKLCAWAFPVLGKLVSTSKVKKYDFDFSPDFLGKKSQAEAYIRLHVTPIHITNAVIALAVKLVFKVLFKILFAKKKSDKSKTVKSAVAEVLNSPDTAAEDTKNKININKDGASS